MTKINTLNQIQGAIFDMDGTISDSTGMWLEISDRLYAKYDIPADQALYDYMKTLGPKIASEYLVERFNLGISPHLIQQFYLDEAAKAYAHQVDSLPYAVEFVRAVFKRGIPACIATASKGDVLRPALVRFGIDDCFDFIMDVEHVGKDKKQPDLFLACAQKMGIPVGAVAVFDDTIEALTTAKNAGFFTVGVADIYTQHTWDAMRKECDLFAQNFGELLAQL